jgi:hypothetical protein
MLVCLTCVQVLGYMEIYMQFGEAENETHVKQLQMSKQTYTVYYPDQQIHNIYIYMYIYVNIYTYILTIFDIS